eukprot:2077919-Amphidinium_carterae.1
MTGASHSGPSGLTWSACMARLMTQSSQVWQIRALMLLKVHVGSSVSAKGQSGIEREKEF